MIALDPGLKSIRASLQMSGLCCVSSQDKKVAVRFFELVFYYILGAYERCVILAFSYVVTCRYKLHSHISLPCIIIVVATVKVVAFWMGTLLELCNCGKSKCGTCIVMSSVCGLPSAYV